MIEIKQAVIPAGWKIIRNHKIEDDRRTEVIMLSRVQEDQSKGESVNDQSSSE